MSTDPGLARAFALFQQHNFAAAEAVCKSALARRPISVDTMHLLALIRKELGDLDGAEQLLHDCIVHAPRQADVHANLGNLLRKRGALQEASGRYQEALNINPAHLAARLGLTRTLNDLGASIAAQEQARLLVSYSPRSGQSWSALAMTLRDGGQLEEAEKLFRTALDVDPAYAAAYHNLGSLLATMDRPEEALDALNQAERRGVSGFELQFNRGRALLQLYRIEEAEHAFCLAVALDPTHLEAQSNLARIRFMRGDSAFLRDLDAAATAHPNHAQLQLLLALVLRRSGDLARAETILRFELSSNARAVDALWALAETLLETQRLQEAELMGRRAVELEPDNNRACETLVAILLAGQQAQSSLPIIRQRRAAAPLDQRWLAYEATAARLVGDGVYGKLYDYERFVQTYDLDAPAGWPSMRAFNSALLQVLAGKHRWAAHPLDQSLRHGSQTARNLLTEMDPVLRAAFGAFAAAIAKYQQSIGRDPSHPFSSRNQQPAKIVAAWSVQLRREGFHVNHVHPHGWLSSAYYVEVPPETGDDASKSGWLKFGEPRFPTPGAGPAKYLQPRAGRLVLFPSYMWHGTNAIHGEEPRTSIAFDAVPAERH